MFEREQDPAILAQHLGRVDVGLTGSLAHIVLPDIRICRPSTVGTGWGLRESDEQILTQWGLPRIEEFGFIPNFQMDRTPKVASDGRKFYSLGTYNRWEIGYLTEQGAVTGFPIAEWPETFVNTSLAAFVETSWRWYWVWREVKDMGWFIEKYDVLDRFLEFAIARDPQIAQQDRPMWKNLVESWI